MAFIYRYNIRNKKTRDKVNLNDFNDEITSTIQTYYLNNLKDCRVEKEYYEYKLHARVSNQDLREFGKQLQQKCVGLSEIWQSIKKDNTAFFIRKMNWYYGFLNREENAIELIDVIDFINIDHDRGLTSQAMKYLDKYIKLYNIKSNYRERQLDISTVARNFYMDVFALEIDNKSKSYYKKVLDNENNEIVLIKGLHQGELEQSKIIAELDVNQLRASEISDSEGNTTFDNRKLVDGFKISSIRKLDKDKVDRVKEIINMYIQSATSVSSYGYAKDYKDINFTVHNVGQALCTSLSILNAPPFLYFDFGISEGPNEFNRPSKMTIDVSQKPSIVLSHIHKDHWYGITVFTKSFECDWYIPKQDLGLIFQKRCAEIIVSGGNVSHISTPIVLLCGTIFISQESKCDKTHLPVHKHDNGLAMKLKLYSKEKKDVNILVAGDQRYDYMPLLYLDEIDILVASHHGGEYSWSKRKTVHEDIPKSKGIGQIIYSYGINNTHKHPSKMNQYSLKGWSKSHKTQIDSDYKLK